MYNILLLCHLRLILTKFPILNGTLGDPNILRDIGGLMISCAGNILSLQLLLILPL